MVNRRKNKFGKPYITETKPGRFYVRKNGRYLAPITAPLGTEEFDRQYWAILNGRFVVRTSLAHLISDYRKSDRWTQLKASTRKTYGHILQYVEEKNGDKDATRIRRSDVVKARDANKHRPRFASHLVAILSVLFEHAIELDWMDGNPAKGVAKLKIPKNRQKPHVPWTDEACALFRANAHRRARLVFELVIGSVQQPSDLVNFRWGDYDGEALDVTQGKTDKRLWLPCSDPLKRALDEEIEILGGSPLPSTPIVRGMRGQPLRYTGMAQMLKKERARLEVREHDLHALRYRGVMELAWAGCTDEEIMAYSGHDTRDMVRKYAGVARQRMRAKSASEKRRRSEQG